MTISIFGLGNIGLPMSCMFAQKFKVIGADINKERVEMVNKGISYLKNEEFFPEILQEVIKKGNLRATADLEYAAKNSDVKIIIVPLILNDKDEPDYSAIDSVVEVISRNLKEGDLIIISTTMPVGGSRRIYEKIKTDKKFCFVYAPERTASPHIIRDLTESYEQIIAGIDKESADKAYKIYNTINKKGVIKVSSLETAELIKLLEGIYRNTNIALADEVAKLCDKFNLDFNEIREIFNLVPAYNLHKPTIKIGGHCIPVYPHFVLQYLDNKSLIREGIEIDREMPKYCVNKIKKTINLKNKKILILGLSYKRNVKEDRFSPAYELIKLLKNEQVEIYCYDPYYTKEEIEEKTKVKYLDIKDLEKVDGVIIATDHNEFKNIDFKGIEFVFDGKNFLDKEKIQGIKYLGIGR